MGFKKLFYLIAGMVYGVIGISTVLIDPTTIRKTNYDLIGLFFLLAASIIIYEALKGGSNDSP